MKQFTLEEAKKDQAYTLDEVAAILKIDKRSVMRKIQKGQLHGFKAGQLYVMHDTLYKFMHGE